MTIKSNDFFNIMTTRVDGFETIKTVSNSFLAQIIILIGVYIVVTAALRLTGVGGLDLSIGFLVSLVTTLEISVVQVYRKKKKFIKSGGRGRGRWRGQ
jgi:uncharacterized membrane protein required for colicin V production